MGISYNLDNAEGKAMDDYRSLDQVDEPGDGEDDKQRGWNDGQEYLLEFDAEVLDASASMEDWVEVVIVVALARAHHGGLPRGPQGVGVDSCRIVEAVLVGDDVYLVHNNGTRLGGRN